jgi:hypothetical protein
VPPPLSCQLLALEFHRRISDAYTVAKFRARLRDVIGGMNLARPAGQGGGHAGPAPQSQLALTTCGYSRFPGPEPIDSHSRVPRKSPVAPA